MRFEDQAWTRSRFFAPLLPNEVQIWRIDAVTDGPLYQACRSMLNETELERYHLLRSGVARDEFVIGRGCLRALLAAELRRSPNEIVLTTGPHGKPFIDGVEFNVTHSKGLILIALSIRTSIGIDVEWMNPAIEALEIAESTFAPREIARIAAASPGTERTRAFYRCWVRKEALAKAHGQGITLNLQDFEVDIDTSQEADVCISDGTTSEKQCFFVQELLLPEEFAGALALATPDCTVRRFEIDPEFVMGRRT